MRKPVDKEKPANDDRDVALVVGRSEDGRSYGVVRRRNDEIQLGTLRQLEDGKPIHGEVVKLRARAESPALFDVEPLGSAPEEASARSGPPKISTRAYRAGWDSIWSAKSGSQALN